MDLLLLFMFLILVTAVAWLIFSKKRKPYASALAPQLKSILLQHVVFYQELETTEQVRFEHAINRFIQRVTVDFVGVQENDEDRILVAASAIIPIFNFGDWHYPNLTNVILYPDTFNHDFDFNATDRSISGMVGSGYLNGQMILSQKSLREGFSLRSTFGNIGIHEFVHLLDKSDGVIDGVPAFLLDKPYIMPWINVMHQEIQNIMQGNSDINPYGASNEGEFLAVASEYFFTQPQKMRQHHPELYALLERAFSAPSERK